MTAARTQKGELDPVNWWLGESFGSHRDYELVTSPVNFTMCDDCCRTARMGDYDMPLCRINSEPDGPRATGTLERFTDQSSALWEGCVE
mgnify:CR=1 FL=1